MGGKRPTEDVDFEVMISGSESNWEKFHEAVEAAEKITGIKGDYSSNIERRSQISFLDYRAQSRGYKKFGKITVDVLEPKYWSIGKITRYLDADVQDLVAVFQHEKTSPAELAKLWEKAFEKSGRSSELTLAKKHPAHFFKTYGEKIWGKKFRF